MYLSSEGAASLHAPAHTGGDGGKKHCPANWTLYLTSRGRGLRYPFLATAVCPAGYMPDLTRGGEGVAEWSRRAGLPRGLPNGRRLVVIRTPIAPLPPVPAPEEPIELDSDLLQPDLDPDPLDAIAAGAVVDDDAIPAGLGWHINRLWARVRPVARPAVWALAAVLAMTRRMTAAGAARVVPAIRLGLAGLAAAPRPTKPAARGRAPVFLAAPPNGKPGACMLCSAADGTAGRRAGGA